MKKGSKSHKIILLDLAPGIPERKWSEVTMHEKSVWLATKLDGPHSKNISKHDNNEFLRIQNSEFEQHYLTS